eukprot:CAMPEP_0172541296 /NCGR_PEP_ID=MMETSP1067-20121228/12125_1 /TAXON_ID=265564 ORGANISM="Thalassiosira punctigera, Strain Tpunct2005C2" /NCGR_SAMPLE_ID=MMETSP1067 /ASSEMBLY_ACC=CAM_ASM_000444 /LENGTH=308 /DNA_ID=CAMNT_0013327303 /DNA_START=96 /DNA_END=1019 /DNA_ORIENTATION=-
MKSILLLCLAQHCVPFGLAGSEIRANRAPIGCFSYESRRYSSNSSGVGKKEVGEEENPALEQNSKYIRGLIETLESLLDKWIVSGAMATRRRAYNILQQIERLSMDKDLALRAERMVKRSGMPTDPPPPIPPTEHIPAVDQQQSPSRETNVVNKPMGAMATNGEGRQSTTTTSTTTISGEDRKEEANQRLAWEREHREKTVFMNSMKDNKPRSALSARMAGGSKGGDPFLNGVVEGTNGGLDPFSFAEDKKELQDTMSGDSNSASTSDVSADLQRNIASGEPSAGTSKNFKQTVISTGNRASATDARP